MTTPADGPLLVFGPRSLTYDFGPSHPLSPRRFGPGIELLRSVGAEPGLAPEAAPDAELEWLHSSRYVAAVKRFSVDPGGPPEAGIGPGDDPAFSGMHDAAAAVAGGSIRAMEAILGGSVRHAYHPGGGLHHAMASRASGFCIYNDIALAISRARRDGLRVLYVDFDVHHGDGVQALHARDPGVLTISFHETGLTLFPGTGFVDEMGEGTAAGTSVNIPLDPLCGPDAWLAAVRAVVPPLAAAFGPDVIVSQHGADGHFWDPLAHLALTTTVMGEAARLVDRLAHRYARGRWLASGGGGYAVYSVVPRVWALTWLAGAHREMPAELPRAWRDRWAEDAARHGEAPLPPRFEDDPGVPGERAVSVAAGLAAARTVGLVRALAVPTLLRAAEERGWWTGDGAAGGGASVMASGSGAALGRGGTFEVVEPLTPEILARVTLASRTIAPAGPGEGLDVLRAALADGAVAAGAISSELLVGVALATPTSLDVIDRLAALGVAPEWRRQGIAGSLLRALAIRQEERGRGLVALHTTAERDPFDPLPREVRRSVAKGLLRGAGFQPVPVPAALAAADPAAYAALAARGVGAVGTVQAGLAGPGDAARILASVERWLEIV
jgi:acetoin utilization protein AcuC